MFFTLWQKYPRSFFAFGLLVFCGLCPLLTCGPVTNIGFEGYDL